jgi:hypothetical protein
MSTHHSSPQPSTAVGVRQQHRRGDKTLAMLPARDHSVNFVCRSRARMLFRPKTSSSFLRVAVLLRIGLLLPFSALSFAQVSSPPSQTSPDNGDSLAAAARRSKAQTSAHAKRIFTDENLEATAGPLPRLKMEGV